MNKTYQVYYKGANRNGNFKSVVLYFEDGNLASFDVQPFAEPNVTDGYLRMLPRIRLEPQVLDNMISYLDDAILRLYREVK